MKKVKQLKPAQHLLLIPVIIILFITVSGILSCSKSSSPAPVKPNANATVYYSAWTLATWTNFTYTDVYGGTDTAYSFTLPAAKITLNTLDTGTVLVFIKFTSNDAVYPLTYVDPRSSLTWWYESSVGSLKIDYGYGPALGGFDPGPYTANAISVRYLVIGGGLTTGTMNNFGESGLSSAAGIRSPMEKNRYQQMSYAEICHLFGILQ